jgi:GNAT superfamily N-acetyltransferase
MSAVFGKATGLAVRPATTDDVDAVRAFMLRIFEQDYGYGYQPQWHWDYDDLVGTYFENPRHALILALDTQTDEIVGTAGLRSGGPTSPDWLAERYQPTERTAQIVRVFVHAEHRRRGIARLLVEELRQFVHGVGEYDVICLHTESAVDFWQALGCTLVHDGRTADPPEPSVHFELALLPNEEQPAPRPTDERRRG